jgi:hypothetical protein
MTRTILATFALIYAAVSAHAQNFSAEDLARCTIERRGVEADWGMPLLKVGNTGCDKGKGAKYVMLPPGHKDAVTCTSD